MTKAKYTRLYWPVHRFGNQGGENPYVFSPLHLGETSRRCLQCGEEFVPTMRAQKYCCIKCGRKYRKENGGTP